MTPESAQIQVPLSAQVQVAVNAFREHERTALLLDKKAKALSDAARNMAFCSDEEKAEYLRLTTEIVAEYEAKREKEGL